RRLALAQPLDMAGVANPSVQLHREHPRPLRPVTHEPKEGNDPVQFCTGAAGLPGRLSGIFLQCRTHERKGLLKTTHCSLRRGSEAPIDFGSLAGITRQVAELELLLHPSNRV